MYLGLPVGTKENLIKYWSLKAKNSRKSFYSLNGIGVQTNNMKTSTMAKIYNIYCQPIFNYGLEIIHISKTKLKEFDLLKPTLLKQL